VVNLKSNAKDGICNKEAKSIFIGVGAPQAFTYPMAALPMIHGAKPNSIYPLPEGVTLGNFLPKWWDSGSYRIRSDIPPQGLNR
jgi:hypothetical protein